MKSHHTTTLLRLAAVLTICVVFGCRSTDPSPLDDLIPTVEMPDALDETAERPNRQLGLASGADVQLASHEEDAPLPPEPVPRPDPDATEADALTLDYLEQIALSTNPTLAEALARVNAMRGKWIQVGLPPNTEFGYSGQQLGSGGLAEQHGLFVGQQFIRGGKLRLHREFVRREIQRAEHLLAAQRQRVMTDLRISYYEVLIAQRRISVALRLVETTEEAAQAAEALFNANEVSRVDVMRSQVQLQSARLFSKTSSNRRVAAWQQLATILGVRDFASRPLEADLETDIPRFRHEEALTRLLTSSPEMAVAISEAELARWNLQRAIAEPTPDVDVQAIAQSDNGTGSSNANLQVGLPLPWLDRNQGGIRRARAELVAAEQGVARLELSLTHRFADVFQRYESARLQAFDYSRPNGMIDNSEASLRLIENAYRAGEVAYLELLTAQQAFARTNLAYIEALGSLWAAVAEIEGLLLKGSLDSGSTYLSADALE